MPAVIEKDEAGYKILCAGCQLRSFEECLTEFENLKESLNVDIGLVYYVDISFNSLRDLEGVRIFSRLEVLILDNNDLNDLMQLPFLPSLRILSLNKNHICNLDKFLLRTQLASPFLNHLSLLCNPACPTQLCREDYSEAEYRSYRLKVLRTFPLLRFLDSQKITAHERSSLSETQTSWEKQIVDDAVFHCGTRNWPPILHDRRSPPKTAKYGKLERQYVGANSEGNRFIRSEDL